METENFKSQEHSEYKQENNKSNAEKPLKLGAEKLPGEIAEAFNQNRLLARAMSPSSLERGQDGSFCVNFKDWEQEVDLMETSGLKGTSCTLLVAGENVPTYKEYGFLMNADQSEIVHISEQDSVSTGGYSEDFRANTPGLESLDQLAEKIEKDKKGLMNEVNANFSKESVKGLFTNEAQSPNGKLDMLIMQRKLQARGLDLPIFYV